MGRPLLPSWFFAASLLAAAVPSSALAEAGRPTSAAMSIASGRTLGNDETVLAAGIGWPSLWAGFWLAPSSQLNLGVRASALFGNSIFGFETGTGGELSLPIRFHIFGKGDLDVAIAITPHGTIGQGSVAGQQGAYKDNLGWAVRGDGGLLAGAHVSDAVTIALGVMGTFGFVSTPDNTVTGDALVAGVQLVAGIEALMSRDTMLFVLTEGGWGFAPDELFGSHAAGRIWLGIAYLL